MFYADVTVRNSRFAAHRPIGDPVSPTATRTTPPSRGCPLAGTAAGRRASTRRGATATASRRRRRRSAPWVAADTGPLLSSAGRAPWTSEFFFFSFSFCFCRQKRIKDGWILIRAECEIYFPQGQGVFRHTHVVRTVRCKEAQNIIRGKHVRSTYCHLHIDAYFLCTARREE